jgi:hypothetical protein
VPGAPLAIVLSGDGGWRDIDKGMAEALQQRGIAVVGWDSLRYFWRDKPPAQASADLARVIAHYQQRWHPQRILLVGYSFGATAMPFMYNRLPPAQRAQVGLLALFGVDRKADFQIRVRNWFDLGDANDAKPVLPEIARIAPSQLLCVYGDQEKDTVCPQLRDSGAKIVALHGGHHFDQHPAGLATIVDARLVVERIEAKAPLRLDAVDLELLELRVDGRVLDAGEYRVEVEAIIVPALPDRACVETRVRLAPARNTALQGLYASGATDAGFLLTQCEAEGFRRITPFPDRPDVLARYRVTLRADRARYPLLLANGNPDGAGVLDDGRHWARFDDPHPKPSYLFALVAGRLETIEDAFVTAEGRRVRLCIHAEADAIGQCAFAMECLKQAMRWDEQRFGRCYDLDVFHIVATHDFTMGAMENKGLNIFNDKVLLASPETATDDDYARIESVVAHEYFHNWTGNRITCRD